MRAATPARGAAPCAPCLHARAPLAASCPSCLRTWMRGRRAPEGLCAARAGYEGTLYTIDTQESTLALKEVKSFGTEGR